MRKSGLVAVLLAATITCAYGQAGQFPSGWVQGNAGSSAGQGKPNSVTSILDRAFGSTRGGLIERGSTGWGLIGPGTNGQIFVGVTSGDPAFATMSGDCTITNAGAITCTKTNGVAFGALATAGAIITAGGPTGNASTIPIITYDQYGRLTAVSSTPANAPGVYNVLNNGLVGDLIVAGDGACTSSSTTFTSASSNFTAAAIGKSISINGCAATGNTLVTTIAGVTNSTTITLTAAAGSTATGKTFAWGTDNTSALNTLIASLTNGGTIYFPQGQYGFTGTINVAQLFSITLLGDGPQTPSGTLQNGSSVLHYLNQGSANFIDIQSSHFITLRNLMVRANANSWTGVMATVRNNGNGDPSSILFDTDAFDSPSAANVTCLLLDTAIEININNTNFNSCAFGIKGRTSNLTSSYSNVIHMAGGQFVSTGSAAILNAGELWSFDHVTFEPLTNGQTVVYQGTSGINATNLSFTNCYMADTTASGSIVIAYYGQGLTIQNNQIAGAASGDTAINLFNVKGFNITGNVFISFATAINYGSATVQGGLLSGNAYHNVTTFEGTTGNKDTSVINTGNISY